MAEISREYAEALYMLAEENSAQEAYGEALELIGKLFEENPEYLDFLASPAVPKQERIKAIEDAFAGTVPEDVEAFLGLLCGKGHIRSFAECAEEFKALYQAEHAVSIAKVTSVVELTAEEQKRLKEKLEKMSGHRVELECSLDESILGGVVVTMDGKIMDGSLKNKLHQMKEVMNG